MVTLGFPEDSKIEDRKLLLKNTGLILDCRVSLSHFFIDEMRR